MSAPATPPALIQDHNSNIKYSLSRGLSTPGRCSYCQKIMFFKAYRCKHCRYRCHKKCAGHNHSLRRTHSCHKSHSGEEHWTKVLQANEVNSNLLVFPCHGRRAVHPTPSYEGPPSSPRGLENGATCSQTKDSQENKDSNIFSSLYTRFVQWVASTRKDSTSSSGRRTPRSGRSRSSSIQSNRSQGQQDILHFLQAQMPEDIHGHHNGGKCYHPSISSEDSELGSCHHHHPSYSSTCSSLTATSTSTAPSDCHAPSDYHVPWSETLLTNGTVSTGYLPSLTNSANRNCYGFNHVKTLKAPHSNLTFTISCPLKTKRPSISVPEKDRAEVLCATWPPTGRKTYTSQDDDVDVASLICNDDDLDAPVFDDEEEKDVQVRDKESQLPEALRELSIPYADLRFRECVRVGRQGEIYRGRWHGEVMIHTFRDLSEEERTKFWQELSQLSMVRHENVALFMGACVDLPNLAVVTSVRKGLSLYEQVHLKRDKMSMHTRIHTVRQISQAMGYLHAKGIVMGKLTSKNIYLEPKVKLCLMDYGMPEKPHDRPDRGCITYGHLTYNAPEIMVRLHVDPPRLWSDAPSTQATDIYSFGTILYELISGHFPFRGVPAESVIWQVAKGYHQVVHDLKCNSNLKQLIEQCWEHLPKDRPGFSTINGQLQQNTALHKRHSSSEPERMNRSGLAKNIFT